MKLEERARAKHSLVALLKATICHGGSPAVASGAVNSGASKRRKGNHSAPAKREEGDHSETVRGGNVGIWLVL